MWIVPMARPSRSSFCGAPVNELAFSWCKEKWLKKRWFMVDITIVYSIHGDYFMVYKPIYNITGGPHPAVFVQKAGGGINWVSG